MHPAPGERGQLLSRVELALDNLLEGLERLGAYDGLAVHQECRRRADAQLLGGSAFGRHQRLVAPGIQTGIEGFGVQTEFVGKLLQVVLTERALVLAPVLVQEQEIVVFPEGILLRSALAGFSRPLRLGAEKRKVLIAQPYQAGVDVFLLYLTRRASRESLAKRSLEVAELYDRDRRVGIALEVARLADELRHHRLALRLLFLGADSSRRGLGGSSGRHIRFRRRRFGPSIQSNCRGRGRRHHQGPPGEANCCAGDEADQQHEKRVESCQEPPISGEFGRVFG